MIKRAEWYNDNFKVYVGYDGREPIAYDVLCHSIRRRTRLNPKIIPLKHQELRESGLFRRPWLTVSDSGNRMDLIDNKPFSTEFSHTRWLVPYLNNYEGWALFLDCDMLFTNDIKELFDLADDRYAVMCVKHNHKPTEQLKMDRQPQAQYYRKNWSSFMLINCAHPKWRTLTPIMVNYLHGADLHRFCVDARLSFDKQGNPMVVPVELEELYIGALPNEYNWIEGSSPGNVKPAVVHYTLGGPWFDIDGRNGTPTDGAFFHLWDKELVHMKQCGEDIKAQKAVL